MSLSPNQEPPKLEKVREGDPSKGDQTKTGTCKETEKEVSGIGKTREYEKPSYTHGTKDDIVGSLKVI